jgi:glycosyltransferase involved in cell wall biosynthesis
MPLHIAIDVRRIGDFGIGTYIRNLVRRLGEIDADNRYTLIARELVLPEFSGLPPNFRIAVWPSERGPFSGLSFPLFLRGLGADLFHMPLSAIPLLMPRPYVVTIHDMGSLIYQKVSGARNNLRVFSFRRGLMRADRVIAVSNSTRRDAETVLGVPADRIRTIYSAPDPEFLRAGPAVACVEEGGYSYAPALQRTLDRYQIDYPFLLYAGTIRPQKNIPRLVEAFAVLRGEMQSHPVFRELRLIIIGDEISRHPGVRQAVIKTRMEHVVRFLGFVPIETLCSFYQAAKVFVFPSLYEGFGLPPLEAMACGTPVVCSNLSALPEAVGDAAIIVNPENVFDIARGIRDVLLDRELRSTLIQRGFEQLRRFNWDHTAREVLATYQEVCAAKR